MLIKSYSKITIFTLGIRETKQICGYILCSEMSIKEQYVLLSVDTLTVKISQNLHHQKGDLLGNIA